MTSLILSAMNTWLLYSLMVPSMAVVLCVDLREVQDTLQVERVIHIQVDPEQGLLVVQEYLPVKRLYNPPLCTHWDALFHRGWVSFTGTGRLYDLHPVSGRRYFHHLLRPRSRSPSPPSLHPRGCALRPHHRPVSSVLHRWSRTPARHWPSQGKISTGMKEQYFSSTSLALCTRWQTRRLSSFKIQGDLRPHFLPVSVGHLILCAAVDLSSAQELPPPGRKVCRCVTSSATMKAE